MIWLWMAAAVAGATAATHEVRPPLPISGKAFAIRKLFSSDDFPIYLAMANLSRSVGTRVTISPDGQLRECTAEHPSGDTRLDSYTCVLLLKRVKVMPATWIDGSHAWGVLRWPVTWRVEDDTVPQSFSRRISVPDLEVSVNKLPKRAEGQADVYLSAAVEPDGRLASCGDFALMGDLKDYWFPELVPTACAQAKAQLILKPPKDATGNPVRSVQTAMIRFVTN